MSNPSDDQTPIDKIRVRRMLSDAERPVILADGIEAVKRLVKLAESDSGQCRIAARFVLGLYNGSRFPFDLTDLRCVDESIFEDCMCALRMDARAMEKEVHKYFVDGGQRFEGIAENWGFENVRSG